MVVAQFEECSLPTPEVHGSHLDNFMQILCLLLAVEKTKTKKKRPVMANFKNSHYVFCLRTDAKSVWY